MRGAGTQLMVMGAIACVAAAVVLATSRSRHHGWRSPRNPVWRAAGVALVLVVVAGLTVHSLWVETVGVIGVNALALAYLTATHDTPGRAAG